MSKKQLASGDIFRRKGTWFQVNHVRDDHAEAPHKTCDGHGVVTDWMPVRDPQEAKNQGLRLLARDGGRALYYNYPLSLRLAVNDRWGGDGKTMSTRRRHVLKDFNYLRGWYCDEWQYVGVIVQALTGKHKGNKASLWAVESLSTRYLSDVARELADEVLP